jgi:hypothetical protein
MSAASMTPVRPCQPPFDGVLDHAAERRDPDPAREQHRRPRRVPIRARRGPAAGTRLAANRPRGGAQRFTEREMTYVTLARRTIASTIFSP